jgi:hypothetical protein
MVFQRVCKLDTVRLIEFFGSQGVATVVDTDDDLSAIHPNNPAFAWLNPRNSDPQRPASWNYLKRACQAATLVTVTSPALLPRYAAHGRGLVLPNYLAPHYYGHPRRDNDVIGWPAAIATHPDDPSAVGSAVVRLLQEGARFRLVGDATGAGRAFGLPYDPPGIGDIDLLDWPARLAQTGIGITPLADTRFNAAKSWLKPLELSACGVPWVASPRAEYERLHRLGAGVLAKDPKRWYRELRLLVNDPGRREELSQAGRKVAEDLKLETNAWRWLDAWEHARKLKDAEAKPAARPARNPNPTSPSPSGAGG